MGPSTTPCHNLQDESKWFEFSFPRRNDTTGVLVLCLSCPSSPSKNPTGFIPVHRDALEKKHQRQVLTQLKKSVTSLHIGCVPQKRLLFVQRKLIILEHLCGKPFLYLHDQVDPYQVQSHVLTCWRCTSQRYKYLADSLSVAIFYQSAKYTSVHYVVDYQKPSVAISGELSSAVAAATAG